MVLGGNFAMWGGIFAIVDCTLISIRGGIEDGFNLVVAGFTTGYLLAIRSGKTKAFFNGFVGGTLLFIMSYA